MDKLKLAVFSVLESLTYMTVALLTAFAANFMRQEVEWWMAVIFCLLVAILMAVILYSNKTQGFGFVDGEGDEKEDEDDDSWENLL